MAPSAVQHALLQCLWKTKSPLFCYWSSDNNWNRKSNYWRDCPTGSEKLSAWGLGLAWGTPMAPCIILAWGRFGNRLPISTSTWLSHPSPLHHALLPGSLFSSYTSSSLKKNQKKTKPLCACYCSRMETINRTTKRRIKSVLFAEYATKLKACNHTALFPIMMELIVDTSWGENLFDSALIE